MSTSETSYPERPTLRQRAIREAVRFRFGQIFLYLWVVLGIFVTIEELVLREHGTRFAPQGFAIINALVLGKVILLGEDMKLGRRWAHGRPLIVPILFEPLSIFVLQARWCINPERSATASRRVEGRKSAVEREADWADYQSVNSPCAAPTVPARLPLQAFLQTSRAFA